jgi:hypothetical protein
MVIITIVFQKGFCCNMFSSVSGTSRLPEPLPAASASPRLAASADVAPATEPTPAPTSAPTPAPSPQLPATYPSAAFSPSDPLFDPDAPIVTAPRTYNQPEATTAPLLISDEEVTRTTAEMSGRDARARESLGATAPPSGPAAITLEHDVPAFTERLQDQLHGTVERYRQNPTNANRSEVRKATQVYLQWAQYVTNNPQLESPTAKAARLRMEAPLLQQAEAVRGRETVPAFPTGGPPPGENASNRFEGGVSVSFQDTRTRVTSAEGLETSEGQSRYGLGVSGGQGNTSIGFGLGYNTTERGDSSESEWQGNLAFSRPGVDLRLGYSENGGVRLTSPNLVLPVPFTDGRLGIQASVFHNPVSNDPGLTPWTLDPNASPFRGEGVRLDLVRRF